MDRPLIFEKPVIVVPGRRHTRNPVVRIDIDDDGKPYRIRERTHEPPSPQRMQRRDDTEESYENLLSKYQIGFSGEDFEIEDRHDRQYTSAQYAKARDYIRRSRDEGLEGQTSDRETVASRLDPSQYLEYLPAESTEASGRGSRTDNSREARSSSTHSKTSSIHVKPTISEDLSGQEKDRGAKLRYLSQKLERNGLDLRNAVLR